MAKFPAAEERLFKNKFVCRRCKYVMRSPIRKVLENAIKCRRCGSKLFKPKRKK